MKRTVLALMATAHLACASSGAGGGSSCSPGENRCFGNYLGTCNEDGTTWTLGFCGTEKTCFEGQCQTQVCTPGRQTCEDEWTALACETGLETRRIPCALGEKCYDAACLPESCHPGEMRCFHDVRLTCANPGWVATPCPHDKACHDDQCVPKICVPREGVCIAHPDEPGLTVGLTCNLNGTQWASQTPCTLDQVCQEGFCFPKSAPPPPPADLGLADPDPGPVPMDPGTVGEDLLPGDLGPADQGPQPDLNPPLSPNRAKINGEAVEFTDFVKASILAGETLLVALHSPPMDGVPFPDLTNRRQIIEIRFFKTAGGKTGTFRCEDDTVELWYRFGKYLQGGECKDYDYAATDCIVTLDKFQPDGSLVSGTFDRATLVDCIPGSPSVTIEDGHFYYEK